MKNKPYLRSILGGTDFRCLFLIEKIRYINAVLLCSNYSAPPQHKIVNGTR